jgi:hypothetical protein
MEDGKCAAWTGRMKPARTASCRFGKAFARSRKTGSAPAARTPALPGTPVDGAPRGADRGSPGIFSGDNPFSRRAPWHLEWCQIKLKMARKFELTSPSPRPSRGNSFTPAGLAFPLAPRPSTGAGGLGLQFSFSFARGNAKFLPDFNPAPVPEPEPWSMVGLGFMRFPAWGWIHSRRLQLTR